MPTCGDFAFPRNPIEPKSPQAKAAKVLRLRVRSGHVIYQDPGCPLLSHYFSIDCGTQNRHLL